MNRLSCPLCVWLALLLITPSAAAVPVVPDGYIIEQYVTGLGVANALARAPDGSLYIADYQRGELVRRTTDGDLQTIAAGMPFATGVVVMPNGRVFVAASDCCVYEVVSGTPQVFASGIPNPTSLARKGDGLYVSSASGNTISRVSTVNGSVSTELSGVVNPFGVSIAGNGDLHFISHSAGQIHRYDFANPPELVVGITTYGGTYTGSAFDGRLFWGNYKTGGLYRLSDTGEAELFASGFVGPATPPVIGPNGIVADGPNAVLVADGPNVWRISRLERSVALAAMEDTSGLGHPGVAVSFRDKAAGRQYAHIIDAASGAEAAAVSMTPEQVVANISTGDLNGNGIDDLAVLSRTIQGYVEAKVKDGSDGTLISRVTFDAAYRPLSIRVVPGVGSGGSPGLAVLGVNDEGRLRVQVRDVLSGAPIKKINFDPAFHPFGFEVVGDQSGNGVTELAILGRDSVGRVRAQIKDAMTGQLVSMVYFDRTYAPAHGTGVDIDGDGMADALAVLGQAADGVVRVQVKNAGTAASLGSVRFEGGYGLEALTSVPDVDNSGTPELAVLQRQGTTVRVQVKDAISGQPVKVLLLSSSHEPRGIVALADVSGNGKSEIAYLGEDAAGNYVLQVKDVATGQAVSRTDLITQTDPEPPPLPEYIETEYNDDRTYADTFYINSTAVGSLANAYDVDWFTVDINEQITVQVIFDATSMNFGWWNVYWYDQNMNVLSGRNIEAGANAFEYVFPAYSPGPYYLRVQPTAPALYNGGPYKVTVRPAP